MGWDGFGGFDVVWCGVVSCGVVWYGLVWFGVLVRFGVEWADGRAGKNRASDGDEMRHKTKEYDRCLTRRIVAEDLTCRK